MALNLRRLADVMALSSEQFARLNRADRAKAVTTLNDVARKRIKNLERAGLTKFSPVLESFQSHGGIRKVRGKSASELQTLFRDLNAFLSAKTSTASGARRYAKHIVSSTYGAASAITPDALRKAAERAGYSASDFWSLYNELKDEVTNEFSDILGHYSSEQAVKLIRDTVSDSSVADIIRGIGEDRKKAAKGGPGSAQARQRLRDAADEVWQVIAKSADKLRQRQIDDFYNDDDEYSDPIPF